MLLVSFAPSDLLLLSESRVLLHCGRDISSQRRPPISSRRRRILLLLRHLCILNTLLLRRQRRHIDSKSLHLALNNPLLLLQRTPLALQTLMSDLALLLSIRLLELRQRISETVECSGEFLAWSAALGGF